MIEIFYFLGIVQIRSISISSCYISFAASHNIYASESIFQFQCMNIGPSNASMYFLKCFPMIICVINVEVSFVLLLNFSYF